MCSKSNLIAIQVLPPVPYNGPLNHSDVSTCNTFKQCGKTWGLALLSLLVYIRSLLWGHLLGVPATMQASWGQKAKCAARYSKMSRLSGSQASLVHDIFTRRVKRHPSDEPPRTHISNWWWSEQQLPNMNCLAQMPSDLVGGYPCKDPRMEAAADLKPRNPKFCALPSQGAPEALAFRERIRGTV